MSQGSGGMGRGGTHLRTEARALGRDRVGLSRCTKYSLHKGAVATMLAAPIPMVSSVQPQNNPGMATYGSGVRYGSGARYGEHPVPIPPKKHMAQVKLELQSRTDEGVVTFARAHIVAMTGNADFPDPDPEAVAFLAMVDVFDAGITNAKVKVAEGQTAVSAKDDLRAVVEAGLTGRGAYVQKKSGGLETKILSAAFDVRAPGAPIGDLPGPENLRASFGDMAGEVDLMWDRLRGAVSYIIEMREAIAGASWTQAKVSPKSRATIEGLTSGKTYVFRVCGVGASDNAAWSAEVSKMAP